MRKKFVVIGDSFAMSSDYAKGFIDQKTHFWAEYIKSRFENLDFIISGDSSRDIQTIIDIWIKILPNLKLTDYLIIVVPFFNRTRLPLHKDFWKKIKIDDDFLIDRFCGTASYNDQKIEFWGNIDKKQFLRFLEPQEIINSSDASQLNYIEIIQSLKILSPLNTYIFSWEDIKFKCMDIDNKSDVKDKVGTWETLRMDWIKTNGKIGKEGDDHWSFNMHKLFAEYIIDKFKLIDKKKLI